LVAHTEFLDELNDISVAGEPVMIELFKSRAPDGGAASEAAYFWFPLQYRDFQPPLSEFMCSGQPTEARADDNGMRSSASPGHAFS
jgi:hypothetical protein